MLIDDLMPSFDASERHKLRVGASPGRTFDAIARADFSSNPLVRILLAARALPARIMGHGSARKFSSGLTLREAERFGFFTIAEDRPRALTNQRSAIRFSAFTASTTSALGIAAGATAFTRELSRSYRSFPKCRLLLTMNVVA